MDPLSVTLAVSPLILYLLTAAPGAMPDRQPAFQFDRDAVVLDGRGQTAAPRCEVSASIPISSPSISCTCNYLLVLLTQPGNRDANQ